MRDASLQLPKRSSYLGRSTPYSGRSLRVRTPPFRSRSLLARAACASAAGHTISRLICWSCSQRLCHFPPSPFLAVLPLSVFPDERTADSRAAGVLGHLLAMPDPTNTHESCLRRQPSRTHASGQGRVSPPAQSVRASSLPALARRPTRHLLGARRHLLHRLSARRGKQPSLLLPARPERICPRHFTSKVQARLHCPALLPLAPSWLSARARR